jgi:hypothetical protein
MKKLLALFPVILLLITQVAIAQGDVFQNISNILVEFSGVIFIVAFVIILLLIGGVFPRVSVGGMPWGSIALLIAVALVFIIPQFVPYPTYLEVPENFKVYPLPSYAVDVFAMLGLPREWTSYVPAIIYMFILPFAGIFALVWAFLASLNIFTNVGPNVNRILALIITFITIPVGWFTRMVWVLFSFMGAWSVAVFAVTFIAGVFYRGAGVIRRERLEYKKYVGKAAEVHKRVVDELKELENAPLETIKTEANRIVRESGALLPAGVVQALSSATQAKDVKEAQEEIKTARSMLKKAYK